MLVSAGDGSVVGIDPRTGTPRQLAEPRGVATVGVGAADDGAFAYAYEDGEVVVRNGSHTVTLRTRLGPVRSFAFRHDGGAVAVGAGTGRSSRVILWSFHGDTVSTKRLRGHRLTVDSLAFSPRGRLLASGGDDRTIRLWSVPSGGFLSEMRGHTDMVRALAFSADGRELASGSDDGTVRFWDVTSGQQLGAPLRYDPGFVWALSASRTGSVAAGDGNRVVVWGFGDRAWAKRGCALAERNLSAAEWRRWAPTHRPTTLCPRWPTPTGPTSA